MNNSSRRHKDAAAVGYDGPTPAEERRRKRQACEGSREPCGLAWCGFCGDDDEGGDEEGE